MHITCDLNNVSSNATEIIQRIRYCDKAKSVRFKDTVIYQVETRIPTITYQPAVRTISVLSAFPSDVQLPTCQVQCHLTARYLIIEIAFIQIMYPLQYYDLRTDLSTYFISTVLSCTTTRYHSTTYCTTTTVLRAAADGTC